MRPEALDDGTKTRRVDRVVLTAAALGVFVAHFCLQFILYRGRAVGHWVIADSDLVVFYTPLLLALTGYAIVLSLVAAAKPWSPVGKVVFVVIFTMIAGFFSLWLSMLLPLNTYGS